MTSRPGASRLTSGSSTCRLRRSVSTASATPGYWTLTATRRPSRVTARWTWPIEAAAKASLLEVGEASPRGVPSSSRSSFSIRLNGSGGTSSRSEASVCLNSSRSPSGIAVKSTVESTWPTFIAAPRIWPELLDELARERRGALAGRRVGALGRADEVGGARPGPAQALAGDEAADAAGAGDAGAGGSLGVLRRHFRELRGRRDPDHTHGVDVHFFETPGEWRIWLQAHHATAAEVEVGFRRKASGLPSMTVVAGGRRGAVLRLDRRGPVTRSTTRATGNRFTPRKPRSTWSKVNIAKVEALEAAGKMASGRARRVRAPPEENSGIYSFEGDRAESLPEPYAAVLAAEQAASALLHGAATVLPPRRPCTGSRAPSGRRRASAASPSSWSARRRRPRRAAARRGPSRPVDAGADRAGDAGAAEAAVAVRVLGQVLLVVALGVVERARPSAISVVISP